MHAFGIEITATVMHKSAPVMKTINATDKQKEIRSQPWTRSLLKSSIRPSTQGLSWLQGVSVIYKRFLSAWQCLFCGWLFHQSVFEVDEVVVVHWSSVDTYTGRRACHKHAKAWRYQNTSVTDADCVVCRLSYFAKCYEVSLIRSGSNLSRYIF